MNPDISLIVPCLNEEQNIPLLIEKIQEVIQYYNLSAEIIIVDDLSDDYTFKEALIAESKYSNVMAIHKGLPRGIGNAIKFGVKHANGKMGVILMGDLVDPLHAVPDFYEKIVNEGYDLADHVYSGFGADTTEDGGHNITQSAGAPTVTHLDRSWSIDNSKTVKGI